MSLIDSFVRVVVVGVIIVILFVMVGCFCIFGVLDNGGLVVD